MNSVLALSGLVLNFSSPQSLTANTLELKQSEPKRQCEFFPCLKTFWFGSNSNTSITHGLYLMFLSNNNVQKALDDHFGTISVPSPLHIIM